MCLGTALQPLHDYHHLFWNSQFMKFINSLKHLFSSYLWLVPNRKGVRQGCLLSPGLFNFYAEYIMRNAGLEDTQAGIKIAGRNINNLRHADDI